MKKGLVIAAVVVLVVVAIGFMGTYIMPTFNGASPRPGG